MRRRRDNRIFVHRVDRNNILVFVNDEWLAFATENRALGISREAVLDKPLWGFIADAETRHLYHLLLEKVRTTRSRMRIPFRCDSPDCRRFMEMEVSTLPARGIQFRSRTLKEERREPVAFLEASTERNDSFLMMCAWCKKIDLQGGGWVETERAIELLDLFGQARLPQISHGICPSCHGLLTRELT